MKYPIIKTSISFLLVILVLQGCSSTIKNLNGVEERVATEGTNLPLFSSGTTYEEVGQEKHFTGMASQIHDLDVAIREAELDARKHVVEVIAQEIRVEGTRGLSGPDKEAVGRFFEEAQSWLSNNVKISGLVLQRTYWEKWAKKSDNSVDYFYKANAMVAISKSDYEQARIIALDKLIDKAMMEKNRAAEKAARETKDRLLQDKGGPVE